MKSKSKFLERTMRAFLIYILLVLASIFNASGEENILEIEISIKNHKFEPSIIEVPQKQKIKLIIFNHDATVEEFDSIDLKREKIIPAGGRAHIILSPLKPGRYEFIGEFHSDTAKGVIIVN
jgi:hypothetical protein